MQSARPWKGGKFAIKLGNFVNKISFSLYLEVNSAISAVRPSNLLPLKRNFITG
jgi:hypothetical protein